MDQKEAIISVSNLFGPFLKPVTSLAQLITGERVKITELNEFCRIAEIFLKNCEEKVQELSISKNESEKLKSEYLMRNKINMINSESLLQVKNELYGYKCELKSDYIATEKAVKAKKQKYKKIVSSYECEWDKTLAQYNANPLVVELCQIQDENRTLEEQIEKIEALKRKTFIQFLELEQNVKKTFFEKIIQFSEEMVKFKTFSYSLKEKKEKETTEKCLETVGFNFNRLEIPMLVSTEGNEETNFLSPVDITMFDNLSIPSENLEGQNEEEAFCNSQMEAQNSFKSEENEANGGDYQEEPVNESEDASNVSESEIPKESDAKIVEENDKEAKYFQLHTSEYLKQKLESIKESNRWRHIQDGFTEFENKEEERVQMKKFKPVEDNNRKDEIVRNDENLKNYKMENDETSSEGSCENQTEFPNKFMESKLNKFSHFNEHFQTEKTPSVSSDDNADNGNNVSFNQLLGKKQTHDLPQKGDNDHEDFKSFGGFFTMENENNSSGENFNSLTTKLGKRSLIKKLPEI